jgi:hypothetical protein
MSRRTKQAVEPLFAKDEGIFGEESKGEGVDNIK